MLNIQTYPTYRQANRAALEGKAVVVIDLLRATSTMTAALANGCTGIYPVAKIKDARQLTKELQKKGRVFCGGERDGVKLSGFDFGNSPLEYTPEAIRGASLVLCTTNGTQAVARAANGELTLMGCLNNAKAVARVCAKSEREIVLLCAGTRGQFSMDDATCAGGIISRLIEADHNVQMDDLSHAALHLYESNRTRLAAFLQVCRPCQTLIRLGMQADITACFKEDIFSTVPVFANGMIGAYQG